MPPKGGFKKKPPTAASSDGTATPYIPSLAEQLSYLHQPRPFKNPEYVKNVNRRTKNLKTVLGQERERERADRERKRLEKAEKAENPDAMQVDGEDDGTTTQKDSSQNLRPDDEEDMPTYSSIEAPPSLWPARHYCDITGLEAPYTEPGTGLRYHDKSVYDLIKVMSTSTAKDYLSARGVTSIVK